jgi:hypothetical protein
MDGEWLVTKLEEEVTRRLDAIIEAEEGDEDEYGDVEGRDVWFGHLTGGWTPDGVRAICAQFATFADVPPYFIIHFVSMATSLNMTLDDLRRALEG